MIRSTLIPKAKKGMNDELNDRRSLISDQVQKMPKMVGVGFGKGSAGELFGELVRKSIIYLDKRTGNRSTPWGKS